MKFLSIIFASLLFVLNPVLAQESKARKIPASELKTLDGKTFHTENFSNNGKPIFISFWATWCSPCKKELNAIAERYEEWQEQTGVKVIAISIDDARNTNKVGPYVNGRNWEFEVYLDTNQDFKRAMNVNNVPHSFLLNGNGEIVWQHNSYSDGDEIKIYELIKKLAAGEKIEE
ncbi:MAG: TlpA family protein disulfide reductase [Bacteroidetes bacterium]|nr:TlpA family protein disulfide reductase [Bacteroidota bacterium]HET6243221.1 TlpA disulfide reductase family protein [Bacteroidia bacterium]